MIFDSACTSSRRPAQLAWLGGLAVTLALTGCVLTGIEPDEIDFADDETGADDGSEGDGDPTGAGDGDGDSTGDGDASTSGDGDGDPETGDGDGDPGTSTGDGDGDPSTGDGDGDPTSTGDGDGDGDPSPCADLQPAPVYDGANAIDLTAAADQFGLSCGADGSDALFVYESIHAGTVSFDLTDFAVDAAIAAVGPNCAPLDELACSLTGLELELSAGELVYLVIDSPEADDTGTLTITGP